MEICAEIIAAMYRMNDPEMIRKAYELQDDPEYRATLRRVLFKA